MTGGTGVPPVYCGMSRSSVEEGGVAAAANHGRVARATRTYFFTPRNRDNSADMLASCGLMSFRGSRTSIT